MQTYEERPVCPACDSAEVAKIVFGYPTEETMAAANRGEVVTGGCCVEVNDPAWHCKDCSREW